nr:MAG TPA: hypothetical protein [Caudoviricetes sp.]
MNSIDIISYYTKHHNFFSLFYKITIFFTFYLLHLSISLIFYIY